MKYGVSGNTGKYRDGVVFDTFTEAKLFMRKIMLKGLVSEAGVYEVEE